jgi:hypothetical protein
MENINLDIYWIRHGYSCANYLYHKKLWNTTDKYAKLAPDAQLTDKTVSNICTMKQENTDDYLNKLNSIIDSDYILCSNLTRAIETAYMLFGHLNKKIYIIPYVGEKIETSGLGYTDNIPSDDITLKKNIDDILKKHKSCMDTHAEVSFDIINKYIEKKMNVEPSIDNFLNIFIPNLLNDCKKKKLKLIIVSHSHFMNEITGIYPNNIDIILQQFEIEYTLVNRKTHLFNLLNSYIKKNKIIKKHSKKYTATPKYGHFDFNQLKEDDLKICKYKFNNITELKE